MVKAGKAGTRKALAQRAASEERTRKPAAPEAPGTVFVTFRNLQRHVPFWRRKKVDDYARVFENSRYELRATSSETFLVIIQQLGTKVHEELFPIYEITRVSAYPPIPEEKGKEEGSDKEQ